MRVSTAAIYTFAALVARDLTQQAIAAPNPEAPGDATSANVTASSQSDVVVSLVNPVAPVESIATSPLSSPLSSVSASSTATLPDLTPDLTLDLTKNLVKASAQGVMQSPVKDAMPDPPQDAVSDSVQEAGQEAAETVATVASPSHAPSSIATSNQLTASPHTARLTALVPQSSVGLDQHAPGGMFDHTSDEATLMAQLLAQSTSSGLPTYAPVEPVGLPSDEEVEDLQRRLEEVPQTAEFGDVFSGSPAITISNPTGYGADNFEVFGAIGFQSDVRYSDEADAGLSVGIGLGDATEIAGLQLSYTMASFGQINRDFGSGGFNAKLHHRFDNGLGIAVGWEGFATLGDDVDFEDTVYGSLSYIVRTNPDFNAPFSRIALTAGVGNGRFRSEDAVNNDENTVGVFGSVAARILPPLSAIVEWTGQDLAAGLSIAPIPNFPLVITPAVRDITGAGDGARFVLGMGVSFQL